MPDRYIVFDVETPNCANDRMSAIGVTVVEGGEIAGEFYSLVNPECRFDWFNVQLTGITPGMVEDQPTFPQLWPALRPLLEGGILVAHNAPFDMGVLRRCLAGYQIFWKPRAHYADTVRMARSQLPQLPNHKLDTLCRWLDIDLDHHNAGSDSAACAHLLLWLLEDGVQANNFVREYDLIQGRTIPGRGARR